MLARQYTPCARPFIYYFTDLNKQYNQGSRCPGAGRTLPIDDSASQPAAGRLTAGGGRGASAVHKKSSPTPALPLPTKSRSGEGGSRPCGLITLSWRRIKPVSMAFYPKSLQERVAIRGKSSLPACFRTCREWRGEAFLARAGRNRHKSRSGEGGPRWVRTLYPLLERVAIRGKSSLPACFRTCREWRGQE
jgi:hypothetical protein